MLKTPEGLGIDASGNVYIVDSGNRRIRKVTISTGIITTVAGNGTNGALGDGGLATSASINSQGSTLGFDSAGNLYFADTLNNRIREVKASTGIITTIAGTGIGAYYGDGGAATSAMVNAPEGVAVDWAGNVYIADTANNRIRAISSSTGKMSTVAGTGSATYSGDGGLATSAAVNWPGGVAVDSGGNLYISDEDNNRVRVVANTLPTTTTVTTSNASIYYDVNVTFTAAVTASSGTPTGTVTY
jgi:sugar lactone lactonase YvrE